MDGLDVGADELGIDPSASQHDDARRQPIQLVGVGRAHDYCGAARRRSIDQAAWAEQLGFGSVWLSEHHFADDDYASSARFG